MVRETIKRFLYCLLLLSGFSTLLFGQQDSSFYAAVNGINLHYELYKKPSAPTLLFIHGNGGSLENGRRLIQHFKNNFQVLAVDSRYHGKSGHDERELTYRLMAEDYRLLLEQLGLDSLYLIGESDGGIIGLLLALQGPKLVRKLVTLGANIQPDTSAILSSDIQWLEKSLKETEQKISAGDTSADLRRQKALLNLMYQYPNIPMADLSLIESDCLIISGEKDVIKRSHSQAIADHIPNGQLVIVPGVGHDLLSEAMEKVIALCSAHFGQP